MMGDVKPFAGRFRFILPPMREVDREKLRASIAEDGVQVPIKILPTGEIIEGHNRWQISQELGIRCPYQVSDVDEEKAAELAIMLNVARRHLTGPQKVLMGIRLENAVTKIVETTMDKASMASIRSAAASRIADIVGIASGTVFQRQRKQVEQLLDICPSMRTEIESGEMTMRDVNTFLNTAPDLIPYYELGIFSRDQISVAIRLFDKEWDNYPMLIEAMLMPADDLLLDPFLVEELLNEFEVEKFSSSDDIDIMRSVLRGDIDLRIAIDDVRENRIKRHENDQMRLALAACRAMEGVDPHRIYAAKSEDVDMITHAMNVLRKMLPGR